MLSFPAVSFGTGRIHARNLGKCYQMYNSPRDRLMQAVFGRRRRYYQEFWALRNINLSVPRGGSLGIIGRNGSGKSTLLQLICGTLTPTTGTVRARGRVAALLELGSGFNFEFTGRENVFINGALLGLSRREVAERFAAIADFAEIGEFMDRPVKTYSSGMMVRLAFAVQTVIEPDILIVDEALSVGDIFFAQKCARRMRELRDRGTTLLFVSHDLASVRDLCERAILLQNGVCRFQGAAADAILAYYQLNPEATESPALPSSKPAEAEGPAESADQAGDVMAAAVWHRNGEPPTEGPAHLLAVSVRDAANRPTMAVNLGGRLDFAVLFQVREPVPAHVAVIVKNRQGQTVYSAGSYNHRLDPPRLASGGRAVFHLSADMMLEAGEYTFSVVLGLVGGNGTQVQKLDASPAIGPLRITWDYEQDRAPFFGMFGLPAASRFETLESTRE